MWRRLVAPGRALSTDAAALLTPERRAAFAERLSRLRLRLPGGDGAPAAAVLVPLGHVAGRPGLLYTLRSTALNKHAGEVAFPGGNRDAADADPLATALRETHEEVGLHVQRDRLWATLPQMNSRYDGKPVAAFVADVGELELERLRPEPGEVESVFFLSLEHLCRAENVGHTQYRRKDGGAGYAMPVFLNGPHRVWGLTAILTHLTLSSLVPEMYSHKPTLLKPIRDGS